MPLPMKIYNTMTRRKEDLIPQKEGRINIYSCGPTVYDYFHLGNARPFLVFDVFRRVLEHLGYEVFFVQNFTDIDDKVIRKAQEEGLEFSDIASRYIQTYFEDADALRIRRAQVHPKATDSMEAILEMIQSLMEKGHAYVAKEGVYFSVPSFKEYGQLSHYQLEELQEGASERLDGVEEKQHPSDFALWKFKKEGEPFWPSPWGDGRPGWHIECSAMIHEHLKDEIDIHCGGKDLIFPHHENEIAQSRCSCCTDFAKYWMHNGFINVNHEKMSKSKKNFFKVRTLSEQFPYACLRYFMMTAHYRSPINFSHDLLEAALQANTRIEEAFKNALGVLQAQEKEKYGQEVLSVWKDILEDEGLCYYGAKLFYFAKQTEISSFKLTTATQIQNIKAKVLAQDESYGFVLELYENFLHALQDDLNTPEALGLLFDLIREHNKKVETVLQETKILSKKGEEGTLAQVKTSLLGLYLSTFLLSVETELLGLFSIEADNEEEIPPLVLQKVEERVEAKKVKDFVRADALRQEVLELGYTILDTPYGPRIEKKV